MFNANNSYNAEITPSIMSFDTLQKARQDLIGEIQAVIEYDMHIHNEMTIKEIAHLCNVDVNTIKNQFDKALEILTANREKLDELALHLYHNETVSGKEFLEILES